MSICWVRTYMRLALIPCLVGLTGCWDRLEMNDLSIAIATAVDSDIAGGIRVSVQVAVPGPMSKSSQGGGGTGTAEQSYTVFSGTGKNLSDATEKLQSKVSRQLFVAHRRVFIISKDIAQKGTPPLLDELTRNPQSRLRTNLVVTKGKALDLLKVQYPFDRVPTEAMRKILYGEANNLFKLDLNDLMKMLEKPGADAMIPIVELIPASKGADPVFQADGLAVFHKGRMVGELSAYETRGVLWMREQISRSSVTVGIPGQKGQITCEFLRTKSDFQVKMANGHPTLLIRMRPEFDVVENNTTLDLTDPKNISKVEKAYSADIKDRMALALDKLQHRYHADILGFGDRVTRAYPDQWPGLSKNWADVFSRMPVTIEVDGKIRRVGMLGPSLIRDENG